MINYINVIEIMCEQLNKKLGNDTASLFCYDSNYSLVVNDTIPIVAIGKDDVTKFQCMVAWLQGFNAALGTK